jgi:hypothetical protein
VLFRIPLAPPHTLILKDSTFLPFRVHANAPVPPAVATSGSSLTLREGGAAARAEFEDGVLARSLQDLLEPSKDFWSAWVESLDRVTSDKHAVDAWMQQYRDWEHEVDRKRAERERKQAQAGEEEEEGGLKSELV